MIPRGFGKVFGGGPRTRPMKLSGRLFISAKTVDNHRANIMNKLGIHRAVELIRYAARIGLIDLDA